MAWRIHPDSKKLLDDIGITSIFGQPQTQKVAPPPRPLSPGVDNQTAPQAAPRAAPKAAAQTSLVHSMEFEDVAGAHAVIVQSPETGEIVIEEIPQGGQLAMQGVHAGDVLKKVDGRNVSSNVSLKLVKALVEGKPGQPVELELERLDYDAQNPRINYKVKVIRTLTVSEDVQLGTYEELEKLIDFHLDFTPAGDQNAAAQAHDRLCRKLIELKRGKPAPAPASTPPATFDVCAHSMCVHSSCMVEARNRPALRFL